MARAEAADVREPRRGALEAVLRRRGARDGPGHARHHAGPSLGHRRAPARHPGARAADGLQLRRAPLRHRVPRVDGRLVRAGGEATVMERLARLANGRARRVVIVAAIFFVVAGALGAGVAERLDPDTESVIADERLEDAGFRETGVVVLIQDVDVRSSEGHERVGAITREMQRDPDVASVSGFGRGGSDDFVSRDGRSTYLAVALKPTDDDELQDAAERITDSLADERGV